MKRALIIVTLLSLLVAVPILMRSDMAAVAPSRADDRIIILSPHNETIRREYERAFAGWWKNRTGRTIYVDWRTPGGTSEIAMVIDAGFKAAKETGREGIGVDVFFGGGQPDFSRQARQGRLARLEVFSKHPEWFGEGKLIPEQWTGEIYFDASRTWVGCCLAQFGIAYNPGVLKRIGAPMPRRWDDLGDPRLAGGVALADPSKSGSVARAFELLVQEQVQRTPDDHAEGWNNGLRLMMRMAGNARYFTDSASRIPHDVGQGDSAAGMCIDFYGRSYHEDRMRPDGTSRVEWVAPEGGATYSADPVAVFKGAPHPEIAQAFVEFCLSAEGQQLWFGRPGTKDGPAERALHRLPIRRDAYVPERLADATVALNPYTDATTFTYDRALTGRAFNTLRQFAKIVCIDSHDELKRAWLAMKAAGFPEDAMAAFSDVSSFPYDRFGHGHPVLDGADPLAAAELASELGRGFRANFRKAEELANAARTAKP
jgi:iron(III) transport system substrate-binding protein